MLLVVASCGDGDSGATDESTSTTSSSTSTTIETTTSQTVSTTTRPPTTTTTGATTSTTTLPDPGMPAVSWEVSSGEPATFGRVCIEWETGGPAPPNTAIPERIFAETLAILGVEVSTDADDCDAVLRWSLTGERTSAPYEQGRLTCWSGTALTARAALVVDGEERNVWTFSESEPPPDTISGCPDEDEDIGVTYVVTYAWWRDMMAGTLGSRAVMGIGIISDGDWPDPVWSGCWTEPPTDDELQTVMALLAPKRRTEPDLDFRRRRRLAVTWLETCVYEGITPAEYLAPLVPHLSQLERADADRLIEQIEESAG